MKLLLVATNGPVIISGMRCLKSVGKISVLVRYTALGLYGNQKSCQNDLNSNPLSQTTMALYGDGSEAAIRAMLRQYLDIYARLASNIQLRQITFPLYNSADMKSPNIKKVNN
ncbi:hypothetical protein ACTXT7_013732 [Hymenolepis weldensis]